MYEVHPSWLAAFELAQLLPMRGAGGGEVGQPGMTDSVIHASLTIAVITVEERMHEYIWFDLRGLHARSMM